MNARTAITAGAFGLGLAGAAFGVYSVAQAVIEASRLTQFLVGIGCGGAGAMVTALSMKGSSS